MTQGIFDVLTKNISSYPSNLRFKKPQSIRSACKQTFPHYNAKKDIIYMPKRAVYKNEGEYIHDYLHEASHWTGHETRLDRYSLYDKDNYWYSREEVIAESSAFFLSQLLNVSFDKEKSIQYIDEYSKNIKITQMIVEEMQEAINFLLPLFGDN
jgi:antirestriction protein ArdC